MSKYNSNYTGEQIDNAVGKALNGAVLPVVELTTDLTTNDSIVLNDAEQMAFNAAAEVMTPIIVKGYVQKEGAVYNVGAVMNLSVDREGFLTYSGRVHMAGSDKELSFYRNTTDYKWRYDGYTGP